MIRTVGWAILAGSLLAACSTPSNSAEAPGVITVTYDDTVKHPEAHRLLDATGVMETVAEELTDDLHLAADFQLRATDCGSSNAFYDPSDSDVIICYELVEEYRLTAEVHERHPRGYVQSLMWETVYHEIAHALIDQLELPITGNEEDVADQFVVYRLLPTESPSQRHVLMDVIHSYTHDAAHHDIDEDALASTHSLDAQRAYNYSCYLFGSDNENGEALIDDGFLTEDRATYCEDEFNLAIQGWDTLLADHLR